MASNFSLPYRDDEVLVDKDGIPHFTGVRPELMKEYKRRVTFAYSMLEGEGDTETKEAKDLERKQRRFAKRLMDGLHGEAWQCCQGLLSELPKLQEVEGYKHVLACLSQIEKVNVIQKTEPFDRFFERGFRKKGQALDAYLRQRRQDWRDLQELDDQTRMSNDLLSYFILKQCNLSREDRRQILLSSQSKYDLDEIEKAMRISFYDIHEKEKTSKAWESRPSKGYGKHRRGFANYTEQPDEFVQDEPAAPELEEFEEFGEQPAEEDMAYEIGEREGEAVSDAGASDDDEIYDAYAAMDKQRRSYKDSRQRLKDLQKSRGFFRGELTFEERKAAVAREKERSRCSACGRIGHWAGDSACNKTSKGGPKKHSEKGKGKGKGKKAGKAFLVSEEPMFFTLDDQLDLDGSAYMVGHDVEEGENDMKQDSGFTELDFKRKVAHSPDESEAGWSYVTETPEVPLPGTGASASLEVPPNFKKDVRQMPLVIEEKASVTVTKVRSLRGVRPALEKLNLRELQHECDVWGVKVSGNKEEVYQRLSHFFKGEPVKKKGCSRQCVMLEEEASSSSDAITTAAETLFAHTAEAPKGSGLGGALPVDGGTCPRDRCYPKSARGHHPKASPEPKKKEKPTRGYGYMTSEEFEEEDNGQTSEDFRFHTDKDGKPFRGYVFREQVVIEETGESGSSGPTMVSKKKEFEFEAPLPEASRRDDPYPIKHGQVLPGVPCKKCGGDLVVRENRYNLSLFFGCSRFGRTECKYTLPYAEGLELARASPARRP